MRLTLVVFLCVFGYCELYSQQETIHIRDFGAKPDDGLSDQEAFNKAAQYINRKKSGVKLVISAGEYLVGPGYNYDLPLKDIPRGRLWDVLNLVDCENITIEGNGKTLVKFESGIPVGTVPGLPANIDSAVHIGAFIRLTNSSCIRINNINGDGNNERMRFLKTWGVGDNPYERENDGLFILNCKDVVVTNSSFKNFIRDGSMILEDQDKKLPVEDIRFINCVFNNNGRNGMSWCGGKKVEFYNCQFNYNSRGKVKTNPGAGLDIEPERGAVCRQGKIVSSIMVGNGGYCMSSVYKQASDVIFDSCNFTGSINYAFIIESPRFSIKNSTIAGTALFTYDADDDDDGTIISNSLFTDSLKGQKVSTQHYLASIKGRFVNFTKCSFDSYKVPSVYTEIKKKKDKDHKENTLFQNCMFTARFSKPSTWGKLAFLVSNSKFVDCEFKSQGLADFKSILQENAKNNYQKNSRFIN